MQDTVANRGIGFHGQGRVRDRFFRYCMPVIIMAWMPRWHQWGEYACIPWLGLFMAFLVEIIGSLAEPLQTQVLYCPSKQDSLVAVKCNVASPECGLGYSNRGILALRPGRRHAGVG